MQSCATDHRTLCNSTENGSPAAFRCLLLHHDKVSTNCVHHLREYLPDGVCAGFEATFANAGPKNDIRSTDDERVLLAAAVTALREELRDWYKPFGNFEDVVSNTMFGSSFTPAGLDYLADKFARAIVHKRPFVVGVIGSSVAAGHDNCHYDAYESQMEHSLQPVLSTVGVDFQVRNAGQTGWCGNDMFNQIFCLNHMVGADVDVTHYTWTYFEQPNQEPKLSAAHEAFVRWSLLMPRAPAPLFLHAVLKKDDWNMESERYIHRNYSNFGVNSIAMFAGPGHDNAKWGNIGDGAHNTTRYGAAKKGPGFNIELGQKGWKVRQTSLGVTARNWHPGPLVFEQVSDAIVWHYTDAIMRALQKIDDDERMYESADPPKLSVLDLPQHACKTTTWCDTTEIPACTNYELPTFGRPGVHYVSEATDTENPFAGTTVLKPRRWDAPDSAMYPDSERNFPECQQHDHCAGINAKFMTWRLPKFQHGYIAVCCRETSPELNMAGETPCGQRLMQQNVTFQFDPSDPPKPLLTAGEPTGKCALISNSPLKDAPKQPHVYLSLNMTNAPYLWISHFLVY
jgi:hypothetical protein